MSDKKNLLVELLVEERPPKALKSLGEAFAETLAASLRAQGLASEQSVATPFASPRRLAVHVSGVLAVAPDRPVSAKLMPVAVALDAAGAPTPALLKKLASLGADASAVPGLRREGEGKGEALFLDSVQPGATLAAGLQQALDAALAALPIPKLMTYQLADGWSNVQFVRPAHGLVALHGADVVPVASLGLESGRETHGHRFEALVEPVQLLAADHYARVLEEQGAVIASFRARRAEIVRQLTAAAAREGMAPVDDEVVNDDKTPFTVNVEKIPTLRPAFNKDGLVTAATSSSISDGAAALVMMSESEASKRGAKPLARLVAQASIAHEPEWFTTAPVGAIQKVLAKAGWKASDVDLYEVNEAFAVVTTAGMKDIGIGADKVNVNGGAVALGHPIGATGARIITTLIYALKKRGLKKGVAALCIGGGEATAVALEVL